MKKYLSLVKFEHTLFALPIVIAGAAIAGREFPDGRTMLLIIAAATGARAAALVLNRIIDREIDAKNPRTKNRALPSGAVTIAQAWSVCAIGLAVYFLSAWILCPLAFYLSPLPVAVFAAYPYMKRRTFLCHFGVGFALALAPLGGWIAVRCAADEISVPLTLGIFTLFWVAGFDIIYSTADEKFDRENSAHSLPATLGSKKALLISALCHLFSAAALTALQIQQFQGNGFSLLALALICAVLTFGQIGAWRSGGDFFKPAAAVSALVLVFISCGIYLG